MTPIVCFRNVGKRYTLRRDRPRSLRELFVRPRWLLNSLGAGAGEGFWALRDVSFEVHPGETVGLVGRNGAGKSTALKLMSRVIEPNTGEVTVRGRVGALLELGTGFHPDLSGRDNVYLSGALAGFGRDAMQRKFDAIVDFAEMAPFIDMPVKHYSSGMFARLAFAVSIHLDPELLLVDEVLAVGDLNFQRKCLARINALQSAGVTICFVSHSPDMVMSVCRRALWIEQGRLQADGPADAVVRQYLDSALGGDPTQARDPNAGRWGSREVEITRVRFTNAAGQPQTRFEIGEPMCIHLDYFAHMPVTAPVFGIALHGQDGTHITGPNTAFSGYTLPTLEGAGTVTYRIPAVPLLEGVYQVTAAAINHDDTHTFDYHDRAFAFRVVPPAAGPYERYGLLSLGGEWAHTAGGPPGREGPKL